MVKNIYFGDFLLQIVLILIRLNRDRLISKWQSGLNLVEYCKVIKKEVEERTVETIVKINCQRHRVGCSHYAFDSRNGYLLYNQVWFYSV